MSDKFENIKYDRKSAQDTALVVLSGGQDSTTSLAWARNEFRNVHAITFSYGQRHAVEIEAARKIGEVFSVSSHRFVDLTGVLTAPTALRVSSGQLDLSGIPQLGVADTFVPMRNQMMLTVAANYAYCIGAANVVTGVCQTDSSGYPDCREGFIELLEQSIQAGTFTGEGSLPEDFFIQTPLMHMTKAESVHFAIEQGAYAALALSHTAYTGGGPLDTDAASVLRQRGFEEAGVPDPLVLRWLREGKYGVSDLPQWYRDMPYGELDSWEKKAGALL